MNENYYAVERKSDSLQHYGVRGMKWGVKKAVAAQSEKKMARAYRKAEKRLKKLQTRANMDTQKAIAGVQAKKAIKSGIATAANAGVAYAGANYVRNGAPTNAKFTYYRSNGPGKAPSVINEVVKVKGTRQALRTGAGITLGSGALAAAGAAKTAYHTGKAIAAKYRTTKKGHAKAVAKAENWKKEMDSAFQGKTYEKKKKRNK